MILATQILTDCFLGSLQTIVNPVRGLTHFNAANSTLSIIEFDALRLELQYLADIIAKTSNINRFELVIKNRIQLGIKGSRISNGSPDLFKLVSILDGEAVKLSDDTCNLAIYTNMVKRYQQTYGEDLTSKKRMSKAGWIQNLGFLELL